jgi:hypothetical protein
MIPLRDRLMALRAGTLLLLSVSLALTACGGIFPAQTLTPTIYLSETPTITIQWFPATRTPTAFPTQMVQSTPEMRIGAGALLFSDIFDQPALWNTSTSDTASASVTLNRLVLSITGPGPLTLTSLRLEPVLGDFYAEVDVKVSLCRGADAYGMVFRSESQNYYRFLVNCNGETRLERVRYLQVDSLQDWIATADAIPGAPSEVRLGVWAAGGEMRFFLNNHYQFTARDPLFRSGTLGFFVRAAGATPVTVSFATLNVYAVSYVSPTPTLTPTSTRIPTSTP